MHSPSAVLLTTSAPAFPRCTPCSSRPNCAKAQADAKPAPTTAVANPPREVTRHCATCFQTKSQSEFLREPIEPFHFQRQCRACQLGPIYHPSLAARETDYIRKQRDCARRLEMEFEATSGQARFKNTMQRLEQSARASRDDSALEAALQLQNPYVYEQRSLGIQKILSLSQQDTLQLTREQAELLLLPTELLAERLLQLKMAVPKADVSKLVGNGPWLLLLDDVAGHLQPVLRQLQNIMPAFKVDEKLHEGAGVWWSAADILRSNGRRFKYTA